MYTTNAVESVHSSFRKVTKGKGDFPNEKAVIKVIYLRIQDMLPNGALFQIGLK